MREKLALLLLILLSALSVWNISHAERLSQKLHEHLTKSEIHAMAEEWQEAQDALDKAFLLWNSSEGYTHIFIRHSETDSCSDAFYELKQALYAKEWPEAQTLFEKLHQHIHSIADMEKIRLGNIL